MRTNYSPVRTLVFVNTKKETFARVAVSTHNTPTVRVRIGKIGRSGVPTLQQFESREEAREHADVVVDRLINRGYKQVA